LAHTLPSLKRLEGRVIPLMAAPLTMSVILMALLDLGPDVENVFVYLEIPGRDPPKRFARTHTVRPAR
jgi:hypothetical protein